MKKAQYKTKETTSMKRIHIPHLFVTPRAAMIVISIIFMAGLGAFATRSLLAFKMPMPETQKNEMKELPADVKHTLQTRLQTASVSAPLAVPILMYHYVEYVRDTKDTEREKLDVTPYVFEQQIQTLLNAGYTFITAKDLGDVMNGEKSLPKKPVILTFDDGHWDLDTVVLPILEKYHIHITAYIVPGFIGTNTDSLTPSEMQEIVASGLVDVGDHTIDHVGLKGLPLTKVQEEVMTSKQMLEQTYHIHVFSFAYPYGSFDQQAINVVKQAGFTTAASTIAGAQQNRLNRFFLYRIRPGGNTGENLLRYITYWESVQPKIK